MVTKVWVLLVHIMSVILAPRKRAIFNRKGRGGRYSRNISLAMAFVVSLSVAFAIGIEVGSSNAEAASGITASVIAANSR